MMDGGVGFVSRAGEGSTFWLELSAPIAEPRAEVVEDDGPPVLEGLRALLVEDNPTNRLVASKMLEALGVSVAMAEHGGLGVEAAQTGEFDLILMDVQMPVMDGLEATRRIRALDGPAAQTPIIGLTANAMAHQRDAYMAAGMDGLVAKPISPSALVSEIARVVRRTDRGRESAAA
jgi:CheY-like chemotaxis protein